MVTSLSFLINWPANAVPAAAHGGFRRSKRSSTRGGAPRYGSTALSGREEVRPDLPLDRARRKRKRSVPIGVSHISRFSAAREAQPKVSTPIETGGGNAGAFF